jgi:hypothetical protein
VEDDYRWLLLSVDKASIANKMLRYKTRGYLPVNETALDLAEKSTSRPKQITIRVDRTRPYDIFVPTSRGQWAEFRITEGGENELAGLTLDEEEALAPNSALLWARAEHEARVDRVTAKSAGTKRSTKRSAPALQLDKRQQLEARNRETADMKKLMTGKAIPRASETAYVQTTAAEDDLDFYKQQKLDNLAKIREDRDKRMGLTNTPVKGG